jgi:glycerol-3-phosphate dehydrogenase
VLDHEPALRQADLRGGALYYDAQCDDARLTLAVIRAAALAGARVVNHARVMDLVVDRGQVAGVRVLDDLSGLRHELRSAVVVNATGPWCDEVRRLESAAARPLLRPTRGAHILLPRGRVGNRNAILFTNPVDGRVMFVLPWETGALEWTYVGTTDTDAAGPADSVSATQEDIGYLLQAANSLFPQSSLAREDVVASWAGLRPLIDSGPEGAPSRVSREHRIEQGPAGLLTIAGGKLTTFRSMAAEVVDAVCRRLGRDPETGRERSAAEPLPGAQAQLDPAELEDAARQGLPIAYLAPRYGGDTRELLTLCRTHPGLAETLHPEHPAIGAQVVFALRQEFARTVEDVLARRVRLRTETRDGGAAAEPAVRRLLEDYL